MKGFSELVDFPPGSLLHVFAPSLEGPKRTHRIGKPHELEKDQTMPRKKKTDAPLAPTLEEASERARKKRSTWTKAQREAQSARVKAALAGKNGPRKGHASTVTFTVDENGVVTINAAARIALSRSDTIRLHAFIDRTESLRK